MSVPIFGPLKWVVTATPKSGTTHIGKWLTSRGYATGHEQTFKSPYPYDPTRLRVHRLRLPGESSWLAAPWTSELRAAGVYVIHLHRPHDLIVESLMRRKQFDLTRPPFSPVVGAYTTALDEEPHSRRQFEVFVDEWIGLIDADVTWDLLDLHDGLLNDLP